MYTILWLVKNTTLNLRTCNSLKKVGNELRTYISIN